MNRWNEIELAAADRRSNDLRNANLARQLRAARADHLTQAPSRGWMIRIKDLLPRRLGRTTMAPEAGSVGSKQ